MKWLTRLGLVVVLVLVSGCGGSPSTVSPSEARTAFECRAVKALQAGEAEVPVLEAALAHGDPHQIVDAANAVVLKVGPSYAARSTDLNPADTLDPLVGAALGDLVQAAGSIEQEYMATPPASPGPTTVSTALAALDTAGQAVQAAVSERDRLVANGSLRCP